MGSRHEYRYTAGQRIGAAAVCAVFALLLSFLLFYKPNRDESQQERGERERATADSLWRVEAERFREGLERYTPQRQERQRARNSERRGKEKKSHSVSNFKFDPNEADSATLVALGFSPRAARNTARYREAGGRFVKPEDMLRIYGIDTARVRELYGYMVMVMPERDRERSDTARQRYARKNVLPPGCKVDLNSADTTELMRVPRIGSRRARQIVNYRRRLGGYCSTGQIEEACRGMEREEVEMATAYLSVTTDSIRRIEVNRSGVERLDRHPYINFYQAKAIYEYRWERGGCIESIDELRSLPEFSEDDVKRIEPYMDFDCRK